MLGAIAGDIIGSIYEHSNIKTKDFALFGEGCRFTDDTVCTVAVADCLLSDGDFGEYLSRYFLRHSHRGYGAMFARWAQSWNREPYGSWGNGSAMRVSSVAYFAKTEHEILELAERSASVSHNHPDAVAGAQAVALAIWWARGGMPAGDIREDLAARFSYNLSQSVDEIRDWYSFDVSCAGSVPQALTCALEAADYEDAIRNAISIGGDSDTIACIAGGIAEAMFGLPEDVAKAVPAYLTPDLREVVDRFSNQRWSRYRDRPRGIWRGFR